MEECLLIIEGHTRLSLYRKRKNYNIEGREVMAISPLLTEIAKKLNPKIESVEFDEPESGACASTRGVTFPEETYWIEISEKGIVRCPSVWLFLLYHEVRHIQHFKEGYRKSKGTPEQVQKMEEEANEYAYKKMGMIGDRGQIEPKRETCYWCIKKQSKVCLKGFEL